MKIPVEPGPFDASALDRPGTVLFDDRPGGRGGISYLLTDPLDVITAHEPCEVAGAFSKLAEALDGGRFVAGYLAYDAGLGLDKPLVSRHKRRGPLVWLGVYSKCRAFDADPIDLGSADPVENVRGVRMNVDAAEYAAAVRRIKQYIEAGDVYQVNYTCKLFFEHMGTARGLFARLRRAHPVDHSAFIQTGDRQILSLSPELFLRVEGGQILARPMKGTSRRGRWLEEDVALARGLASDPKNRAENVMIVDLMRNDLGRICRPATVRVPRALHVDRYRSLFQMTSDVCGELREGLTVEQLLRATFPPGSVTGAPKLRALEIIDELERESRGVYCGSVALFAPCGDCLMSVAIRTIVREAGRCELGVGSGIVADSEPEAEWAEVQLKGDFLAAQSADFELLETLRVPAGGVPDFLEEHLRRMRRSAEYFGWDFPEDRVREKIEKATAGAATDLRLRVLLAESGECRVEAVSLEPISKGPARVLLASRATDPTDVFLYHKTTRRAAYDADAAAARQQGFFEVLYCNDRGEVTEGAITNVAVLLEGRWLTPPIECGLLPGVWRADMLARGKLEEAVLTSADLKRASRIVLGNSVRGTIEVGELVEER